MSNPSITRVVKYIRKGEAGEDAVAIQVTGENIVFTKVGQIAYVYVDAYKGQTQIAYQDDFVCSVLGATFYICDKNVFWGFATEDGRFYYRLKLLKKADIDTDLPFTVTINGVVYNRNIHISTAFDGDKGDRGPAVRGPQAWSDCAVGYSFQAGGDDEEWKDVVLYNGNYYSCILSHTKTADNYPTSTLDTNNGYWKLADAFEIVATKILLAQYALVKNLGVETIDMKDSSGNILFQAKDGTVTCNTGNFTNVVVKDGTFSGILNASLYYGRTKVITATTYSIDPEEEPYNCFVVNEPTSKHYIILPKASEYDGVEFSFFVKTTNWTTSKDVYIKASGSPELLYVKQNIYSITSGSTVAHVLEDYNATYTGDTAYWRMTPNMLIKIKSMFGHWYCLTGLWTGE